MPASLGGELRDACRGKTPEQVLNAHGRSGVAACLVTQGRDRVSRIEVKLVEQARSLTSLTWEPVSGFEPLAEGAVAHRGRVPSSVVRDRRAAMTGP